MEMEFDHSHGPCGIRNFTEVELFLEAKIRHYNSECYQPSFLIRIHNLTFKRVVYGGVKSKSNFQPQDLTINIRRGEIYSLGQPDSFDKAQKEGQRIDESDKTAINLFGDCYSPFVSDEHFAVGRDEADDKVWILDLNSKQGTFVNGTKLAPQITHKLKDGDIISLGISHLHPKCKLEEGIFWVFKYKEVSEEEVVNLKTLYSQVLGNSVILSNILNNIYDSYKYQFGESSTNELIKVRSVSKIWNEISLPILRKKLELNFNVNQERGKIKIGLKKVFVDDKENMWIWGVEFNQKDVLFSSFGLQKLNLKEIEGRSSEIGSAEVKLFENFFRSHRNQILKADLGFSLEPYSKRYMNREQVLRHLFKECKSIVHFEISKECSASLEKVPISTSTTKLTISCRLTKYENVLRTFPNVTEIRLESSSILSFLMFATTPQNQELIKGAFTNLKMLKVSGFRLCNSPMFLKFMKDFPIKIEGFDLEFLSLEQKITNNISDVISAFADSLKIFKFTIAISERMLKAGIQFPKMEKLENLEITLNNLDVISWSFELGGFPNLKVINVKVDRKENVECDKNIFLESLLSPENRQYFPKLERAFVSYGQLQSKNFANL